MKFYTLLLAAIGLFGCSTMTSHQRQRSVATTETESAIFITDENAKELFFQGVKKDLTHEITQYAKDDSGLRRVLTYEQSELPFADCFRKVKAQIYHRNGSEYKPNKYVAAAKAILEFYPDIPSPRIQQADFYCRVFVEQLKGHFS